MLRQLLVLQSFLFIIGSECSELLSLTLLYRHGSRAPRKMFAYDPYRSRIPEIWPEGLEELTNLGKQQQYNLGKWYRERYSEFIPEKYDPTFLRVLSSNKDRCLMSAAANLAGLFPPKKEQIWNNDILWQPIPIHTSPPEQDVLISKQCTRYNKLFDELKQTEYYKKLMKDKKDLFDNLSKNAGENVTNLDEVTFFHDTLFIEEYYNLTIPEWTKKVYPVETLPLLTLVYVIETNNTALGRLKSGPFIDYIATFLEDSIEDPVNAQKLLMFSVHDSTLGHFLNTLNVYDGSWFEYASTVMIELRRKNDTEFVNIYFKNSTGLTNIQLNGCEFDCPFERFRKLIEPVRITAQDWEIECQNNYSELV